MPSEDIPTPCSTRVPWSLGALRCAPVIDMASPPFQKSLKSQWDVSYWRTCVRRAKQPGRQGYRVTSSPVTSGRSCTLVMFGISQGQRAGAQVLPRGPAVFHSSGSPRSCQPAHTKCLMSAGVWRAEHLHIISPHIQTSQITR